MDATHFDALTKILVVPGTRRGLLRFLPGLPLSAALTARLVDPAQAGGSDRDDRRDRRGDRRRKKKKGKGNGPAKVCQGQADGTPCGEGGSAVYCCQDGECPAPRACTTSGDVSGRFCPDCAGIQCCAQQGLSGCGSGGPCFCFFAEPGEPCESDADCFEAGIACICQTCQALTPP